MENKKYLDKVLEHLIRGTKIDYGEENIFFPFSIESFPISFFLPSPYHSLSWLFSPNSPGSNFSVHCRDQFGLTKEEIKYVWKEYRDIIKVKIKDGK